ncbi:MAG: sensor histidine kinase [Planctomycetota bacterium]|jgi:signal transduction histidine kinase
MHKRFWLICSVIALALLVLSVLGLWSLRVHKKGIVAERQQEFISVAEQIRFAVKKNLDTFIQTEQDRPYTDYQAFYVPEASNQAAALLPSPLNASMDNGLAYGYFQLDAAGNISTPYFDAAGNRKPSRQVQAYLTNLSDNLLPSLATGESMQVRRVALSDRKKEEDDQKKISFDALWNRSARSEMKEVQSVTVSEQEAITPPQQKMPAVSKKITTKNDAGSSRRSRYSISSFEDTQQVAKVQRQSRETYEQNVLSNTAIQQEPDGMMMPEMMGMKKAPRENTSKSTQSPKQQDDSPKPNKGLSSISSPPPAADKPVAPAPVKDRRFKQKTEQQRRIAEARERRDQRDIDKIDEDADYAILSDSILGAVSSQQPDSQTMQEQIRAADSDTEIVRNNRPRSRDTVQVRIEPFVPLTVADENGGQNLFAGQVFLMRHIQIENLHLLQGFRLNENALLTQVRQSAAQLIRRGMGFDLSHRERTDAAYTAVLDFGFGEMVLNLLELQPGYIQGRVDRLRNWFMAILSVVWLAVVIALATFWRNMQQQVQLSRKKDDFISAVSHELRTPLTSIRMYTEMLEKDWVKTDEKRKEYYTTMRQESERLSRLIENVLDYSRIQRGRKQYDFAVGDVNECIRDVMDMMAPYIEHAGFSLESDFERIDPFTFDRDAVVQIVINLLDNALKYAKQSDDKRIIVRTRTQSDYAILEIEDRGPGIPRSQQKKIFEAFYRCADESTRQATGTGLGLALVKRFAEAHHGFVEILNAKPSGALFRIGLANHFGK